MIIWPFERYHWRAQVERYINQHQTFFQQLWKRLDSADKQVGEGGDLFPLTEDGGGGGGDGSQSGTLLGKTPSGADAFKGTFTTVNLYTGTMGSETPTGATKSAYVRYGDILRGKWVRIVGSDEAGWEVLQADGS